MFNNVVFKQDAGRGSVGGVAGSVTHASQVVGDKQVGEVLVDVWHGLGIFQLLGGLALDSVVWRKSLIEHRNQLLQGRLVGGPRGATLGIYVIGVWVCMCG